jgi:hypothetical protein
MQLLVEVVQEQKKFTNTLASREFRDEHVKVMDKAYIKAIESGQDIATVQARQSQKHFERVFGPNAIAQGLISRSTNALVFLSQNS